MKKQKSNSINSKKVPKTVSPHLSGAFWKVVSCACFAGINVVVRYLSGGAPIAISNPLPPHILMFFQNVLGTLFMLPWVYALGIRGLQTQRPVLHFIRVLASVAGIYLWYLALQKMPIAEAVALNFTGPLFTVVGASYLLKEHLQFSRVVAISLSIVGAFIISRPDIALCSDVKPLSALALLPLSSAVAFTLNKLLTRKLANLGESPTCLATYLLVLMIPISAIPAFLNWVPPEAHHWPGLILLGALATGAHFSFSKAYQLAEVTFLTPIGFAKFFLSAVFGWLIFSEWPTGFSFWLGTAIIVLSIVLSHYNISLYSAANRLRSSWFKNKE